MLDQAALTELYRKHGLELSLEKRYDTHAGPVWGASLPGGEEAVRQWEQLRALTEQTGYWPLLTGTRSLGPQDFEMLSTEGDISPQSVLAAAEQLDASAWFAARMDQLPGPDEEDDDEWAEFAEEMGLPAPGDVQVARFATPYDVLSQQPLEHVLLALVPTTQGWEAAAYLLFGGWNACPDPEEQVAIHKYWHARYGAEPVAITNDIVEMRVARPPIDDDAALVLAQEQFLYCDDIVYQGVMTLENLKLSVLKAPIWYFWWD